MRKLLVLADDFTGGLDTGAQFAAAGIPTVVTTNPAYCAADHEEDTVLVVDVETRHLLPEKARQIVEQTIRAHDWRSGTGGSGLYSEAYRR